MKNKPIPAFYCCYLLRSANRKTTKLYIGSTPNPKRRLRQHNGLTKGGANKTGAYAADRPWQIQCIVQGFTSKLAALQFEWAWQNPSKTRHLKYAGDVRSTCANSAKSFKKAFGALKLLLKSPSFRRWPLHIKFFDDEVYGLWRRHTGVAASKEAQMEGLTSVVGDLPEGRPAVESIDVTYRPILQGLRKSTAISNQSVVCTICSSSVVPEDDMAMSCPGATCGMIAHLTCLSKRFLMEEGSTALVPSKGRCPSCSEMLTWKDLATDLSLRMRGQTHVSKLIDHETVESTLMNDEDDTSETDEEELNSGFVELDAESEDNSDATEETDDFTTDVEGPSSVSRIVANSDSEEEDELVS